MDLPKAMRARTGRSAAVSSAPMVGKGHPSLSSTRVVSSSYSAAFTARGASAADLHCTAALYQVSLGKRQLFHDSML